MAIEDFGGDGAGQENRAHRRRSSEQSRHRPGARARMVRRARGQDDFRYHQFRCRPGAAGPREIARSAGDLRFRFLVRSDRQSLLDQLDAVERRQLVERRFADAVADQAGPRQFLLHHRRLRLRRFARGRRARRDRQGGRHDGRQRARAAQHRRLQFLSAYRAGFARQGDRARQHRRDLSNSLKQANEFGITPGQYIATPITYLSDVNALGLPIAHGLVFMQSWYWDLNDATRAFAKRFFERTKRMPNDNQAVLYSSVRHYLEAVAKHRHDDAQPSPRRCATRRSTTSSPMTATSARTGASSTTAI